MKLFFIRHGETTGDVENRYGGVYDDHLSPKGEEQSRALAEALKSAGVEVIYASSLIRAQETAHILADVFECAIEIIPKLQERNQYSFLSGMEKSEALQKYPREVEVLKDRMNTIEGAESYEEFSARIRQAFESLVGSAPYSVIALVSHGGPLRVLFRDILKWGELKEIGDCACVELEKNGDHFLWVQGTNIVPAFEVPR